MRTEFDIIVVGAGMVGLSCALGLAQAGFQVALLESQSTISNRFPRAQEPFDKKVVAISRSSELLLQRLGVWPSIESVRVAPYQEMYVWDSTREGAIHFTADSLFEPNLGYIIEQQVLTAALWQAILKNNNIQYFLSTSIQHLEVKTEKVHVELADQTLTCRLLIGADGAKSWVRQFHRIPSKLVDYEQSAIVATLHNTESHRSVAYQRFASDGPLAWLPLADPHQVSIVWTTTACRAKELCALAPHDFNKIMTFESDGKLGELSLNSERVIFPLHSHHAEQYVMPRCVLVGDAAHTIHPLAGMGVNLGFYDVSVLIDELSQTHQAKRDYGLQTYLKRYERRRRWHNQTIMSAMSLFKNGFGSTSPMVGLLRNKLLKWVDERLELKHFFMRQAL